MGFDYKAVAGPIGNIHPRQVVQPLRFLADKGLLKILYSPENVRALQADRGRLPRPRHPGTLGLVFLLEVGTTNAEDLGVLLPLQIVWVPDGD